ncbi:MAG: hypothetical protein Q4D29_04630 [Lachnospiraceae bacterium]|nr:hypothetical protein [Lachnospiraceae bacterium]
MKKILTNNIGLKILSVLGAIVLWIIVVNVDDPVITRLYTGIPVEIVNASAITGEGKTFEVADGSDTISVVISAERSIIEALTKDNIRATADMKNITFMNTVPIELKSTRYSDKINSITSKTANLSVIIEEKKDKQLKLAINTEGSVAGGNIPGKITPVVDVIKVSGPESKVGTVSKAEITVDYAGMNESFTTSCIVTLYNKDGEVIDDEAISISKKEIRTSVEILETKEIPITAYFVGTAAVGYGATGTVICEPSSVVVAGNGSAFESISSIKIPDDVMLIDGATDNVTNVVNIQNLLPKGIVLADKSFDGNVNIEVVVEQHDSTVVSLPIRNITVTNLPEGYNAHVVYGEDSLNIEVAGLQDDLDKLLHNDIIAEIDATTLTPRVEEGEEVTENEIYAGDNDGIVLLTLPSGVTQVTQVNLEVIINNTEKTENAENVEE